MPLIAESENTLTTVIGSEQTLAAPTSNKARLLKIDLSAFAPGEVVGLRIQSKVRTAGTIRDQYYYSYIGPVGDKIIETVPVSGDLGATFKLTQLNGVAGRLVDWKVLTFDTPLVAEAEGSLTTVIGTTPQQLVASTTNKTRLLRVDLGALVAGDAVYLNVQTKVRSSGTVRDQYYRPFVVNTASGLGLPIIETPPISSDVGATFTVTHTTGASRTVDWKVLTLD